MGQHPRSSPCGVGGQAPCWGPRVEVSNSCSADWLNCWILTRQLSGGSLPGIQGLSPSGEQGLSLKSRAVGGHKVLSRSCSGCTHRGSLLHVCAPASLLLRGLMHWAEPCAAPLAGVTGGDAQLNAARWCPMWRGLHLAPGTNTSQSLCLFTHSTVGRASVPGVRLRQSWRVPGFSTCPRVFAGLALYSQCCVLSRGGCCAVRLGARLENLPFDFPLVWAMAEMEAALPQSSPPVPAREQTSQGNTDPGHSCLL